MRAEAHVTLKPVVDAGSRDDGAALELLVFLLDGGARFERRAAIAGVLEEAARRDGGDEKGLIFDELKSFVEFGAEVRHFIHLFGFNLNLWVCVGNDIRYGGSHKGQIGRA